MVEKGFNRILFIIIPFILFSSINCIEEEDKVLILNTTNFDSELKNFTSIVIQFYAPLCNHCETFAPEYNSAAQILRQLDPPLYLAKVDVSNNTDLANKFSIQGTPTIKFFHNGTPVYDYDGGLTAKEIVQWVKKKISAPSTELNSFEEIEKFKSDNDIVIIYYASEIKNLDILISLSSKYNDILFGHVKNKEIFSGIQSESVVLYKKFDEEKNIFVGEINEMSLSQFIDIYSYPLVMKFNNRALNLIFEKEKSAIFYIRSESDDQLKAHDEIFTKLAPIYRGNLYFVISDVLSPEGWRLLSYFNLEVKNLPQVRITDVKGEEDITNYVLNEEISEEAVRKFIDSYLDKSLKPFIRSEPIENQQTGDVIKLVGLTYKDIVYNSKKSVLVKYHGPNCPYCKDLDPLYKIIGNIFKDDNDKILITEIDATANDIPLVYIDTLPSIKLFHVNDKSNPINFENKMMPENIADFVVSNIFPEAWAQRQEEKRKNLEGQKDSQSQSQASSEL